MSSASQQAESTTEAELRMSEKFALYVLASEGSLPVPELADRMRTPKRTVRQAAERLDDRVAGVERVPNTDDPRGTVLQLDTEAAPALNVETATSQAAIRHPYERRAMALLSLAGWSVGELELCFEVNETGVRKVLAQQGVEL